MWCRPPEWTEELYDLTQDPNETMNLICNPPPAAAAALTVLQAALDSLPSAFP